MSHDVAGPGRADARQRELYGESWSERLSRLMGTYHLSQARLAAVIGLSAPMLSQLITGHRVKISNPAVFGRIVRLEQLQDDPRVVQGDPVQLAAILEEVAASSPVLTTVTTPVAGPTVDGTAHSSASGASVGGAGGGAGLDERTATHLASVADRGQLLAVADAAAAVGADALAGLLRRAAR